MRDDVDGLTGVCLQCGSWGLEDAQNSGRVWIAFVAGDDDGDVVERVWTGAQLWRCKACGLIANRTAAPRIGVTS